MRLGEVARLRKGVSYQGPYLDRPGPLLLGLGTILPGGGIKLPEARTYGGPIKPWQFIRPGEVFVALTDITQDGGVLGSPAFLRESLRGTFAVTHHVARVDIAAPESLDGRFLYYLLQAPAARDFFRGVATGTTVRAVSTSDAEAYSTLVPPLAEQRAIARILGALDDKIELNRRMNETLEGMARALFRSWFVDFDPVRAKAEGRDPGLPPSIADLFPDRFEHSELGEVPAGWRVGRLGDTAENPRRGVRPNEIGAGTAYIALEHMPRGSIALHDWGAADGVESGKFEFRQGEILFGKLRPYFHKVGVAPLDGVCSTDIVVVRPSHDAWFAMTLGALSSDEFIDYVSAGSTGTKMPRTNWSEMARYRIAIPPPSVAQALTDLVRPISDRILAAIHESRTLAAIRDTLLPKLISGEIRVREAERFLEAAPL